jgi:DNA-binding NarL/FixJ family response regulator
LYTVLLCDTEPIAMEGLRRLLESADELRVDASETSLLALLDAVRELRPSLVVLDKALGTHALFDWLNTLRRASSPPDVIVWGVSITAAEALRFLAAGAAGIMRKTSSLNSILHCIRTVVAGGTWMEDDMLRHASCELQPNRPPLTGREMEVMELVSQGLKNREIAASLGICVGTVKIHLKHIFEKTGIHGRYGLAVSAGREKSLAPQAVA